MRDAFGNLLTSPATLTRRERITILNQLAGRLLADAHADVRWLGASIAAWLRDGGRLDAVLGVAAERGSHATAQAQIRQTEIDTMLLRLSVMVGGDRRALRILRGERPCPASAAELVAQLRAARAPMSNDAIHRARRRVSSPMTR